MKSLFFLLYNIYVSNARVTKPKFIKIHKNIGILNSFIFFN